MENTIQLCVQQVGSLWFGVAHDGEELVATTVSSEHDGALAILLHCLPAGASHRFTEEKEPFVDGMVRMLAALERGEEAGKRFTLSRRWVSEPLHAVLCAAAAIPLGYVSSYGNIAGAARTEARVVGRAMASNRLYPIVPCHRVVGSDLGLVGYGGKQDGRALEAKLGRLRAEARGYTEELVLTDPALRVYPVEWAIAKASREGVGVGRQLELFD